MHVWFYNLLKIFISFVPKKRAFVKFDYAGFSICLSSDYSKSTRKEIFENYDSESGGVFSKRDRCTYAKRVPAKWKIPVTWNSVIALRGSSSFSLGGIRVDNATFSESIITSRSYFDEYRRDIYIYIYKISVSLLLDRKVYQEFWINF